MITVELKDGLPASMTEVALCMDEAGLNKLIGLLQSLKGLSEHLHLKTPSWAGDELGEVAVGRDTSIINHLRIGKR